MRFLPGSCPVPARFLPGGRFLPGSCPAPARFLPGSCPAAGSCPVPARFLPGSCPVPARFLPDGRAGTASVGRFLRRSWAATAAPLLGAAPPLCGRFLHTGKDRTRTVPIKSFSRRVYPRSTVFSSDIP